MPVLLEDSISDAASDVSHSSFIVLSRRRLRGGGFSPWGASSDGDLGEDKTILLSRLADAPVRTRSDGMIMLITMTMITLVEGDGVWRMNSSLVKVEFKQSPHIGHSVG